jgi:hypothetical protein
MLVGVHTGKAYRAEVAQGMVKSLAQESGVLPSALLPLLKQLAGSYETGQVTYVYFDCICLRLAPCTRIAYFS